MKYFKKVPGERIYLSPPTLDDISLYVKWLSDRAVTDGLGDSHRFMNFINEKEYMETALKNGDWWFSIILNSTDEAIGSVGLIDVNYVYGSAKVGILIGEGDCRGKGYGTEAMRLLVGYAFDVLNLYNIMLEVFEFNEIAINSYLRVGFKEMGRRRSAFYLNNKRHDVIYMDITREDWYK